MLQKFLNLLSVLIIVWIGFNSTNPFALALDPDESLQPPSAVRTPLPNSQKSNSLKNYFPRNSDEANLFVQTGMATIELGVPVFLGVQHFLSKKEYEYFKLCEKQIRPLLDQYNELERESAEIEEIIKKKQTLTNSLTEDPTLSEVDKIKIKSQLHVFDDLLPEQSLAQIKSAKAATMNKFIQFTELHPKFSIHFKMNAQNVKRPILIGHYAGLVKVLLVGVFIERLAARAYSYFILDKDPGLVPHSNFAAYFVDNSKLSTTPLKYFVDFHSNFYNHLNESLADDTSQSELLSIEDIRQETKMELQNQ